MKVSTSVTCFSVRSSPSEIMSSTSGCLAASALMSLLNCTRQGSMVVTCEKPMRHFACASAGRRPSGRTSVPAAPTARTAAVPNSSRRCMHGLPDPWHAAGEVRPAPGDGCSGLGSSAAPQAADRSAGGSRAPAWRRPRAAVAAATGMMLSRGILSMRQATGIARTWAGHPKSFRPVPAISLGHQKRVLTMATQPTTGHCLCGTIRFETDAQPLSTNFCHCESCRRHTGSAVAAFVSFRKEKVRWSGAERTGYRSSPAVVRSFCACCGSPLAYEHDRTPDEIDLYLGAFDEPGAFPAGKHIHVGERVAWFDTVDQTPRHLKGSDGSEAPVASGAPEPRVALGQVPPPPAS